MEAQHDFITATHVIPYLLSHPLTTQRNSTQNVSAQGPFQLILSDPTTPVSPGLLKLWGKEDEWKIGHIHSQNSNLFRRNCLSSPQFKTKKRKARGGLQSGLARAQLRQER